jgi:hypothetical protein
VQGEIAPAEPACFLDEDQTMPRSFASPAATGATVGSSGEDVPDTIGMQAWWSLSGKPSRT